MCLGLLGSGENTRGLDHILGAGLAPLNIGGILFRVEADLLALNSEIVTINLHLTLELAVCAIILEHVRLVERSSAKARCGNYGCAYSIFGFNEGIVDGNDVNIIVFKTTCLSVSAMSPIGHG